MTTAVDVKRIAVWLGIMSSEYVAELYPGYLWTGALDVLWQCPALNHHVDVRVRDSMDLVPFSVYRCCFVANVDLKQR